MEFVRDWCARRSLRSQCRARHYDTQGAIDRTLSTLHETEVHANRAKLLLSVGELSQELALLEVPAFGDDARRLALATIDDSTFAFVASDIERARAKGGPRKFPWPDLERAAGALLNQLAGPELDDAGRADAYAVLQSLTQHLRVTALPVPILEHLQHWHAARAAVLTH